MRGHGDGGEAQARGRNRLEEEGQELWKLAELAKVVENFGVLGNRVASPRHLPSLNIRALQRADPKSSAGSDWASDLAADEAG